MGHLGPRIFIRIIRRSDFLVNSYSLKILFYFVKAEAQNAALSEWCKKGVLPNKYKHKKYQGDEESSDDTDRECDEREDLTMYDIILHTS